MAPTTTFALRAVSLASLLACSLLTTGLTHAATLTVDASAVDEDGTEIAAPGGRVAAQSTVSDGKCSLREAILSVNTGSNVGDCQATGTYGTDDTINLPAGIHTLTLGGTDESYDTGTTPPTVVNTPNAMRGDLDILKSVRIVGAGSGSTSIVWSTDAIAASAADRIFHVFTTESAATVQLALQGVTLGSGRTYGADLGQDPVATNLHYFFRRAGGAVAVGAAAFIATQDAEASTGDNADNAGGSGGEGESSATYGLTLDDVIIENSIAQGDGGGLYTSAATTASRVVIRGNESTTNGGGVYNEGNTSFSRSTIANNTAEGGGGLFATGSNTVNITGVTFSGNRAVGGGAISGRAGVTLLITNSTISGNIGSDVGAGLYTNGNAQLNFVTIARNLAGADSPDAGSGINLFPASSTANAVTLKNVLLEGNKRGWADGMDATAIAELASANCGVTGGGLPVTSSGSNLSSDGTCADWLIHAKDLNDTDPKIGDLADNGGATFTHALLVGSPALGAGTADGSVTTDQRGVTRDGTPDIGAYETPTGGDGGGCTAATGNRPVDPVLPLLASLGLFGWALRRFRRDR